jgi:hypothetical protein
MMLSHESHRRADSRFTMTRDVGGRLRGLLVALFCVVACAASSEDAWAQAAACDPALMQRDPGPVSYRARGDRCEGIYRQRVSGVRVHLVSFTVASDLRDLCSGPRPVRLVLPQAAFVASGAPSIHVQAESLRPLLYYRLDVEVRAQSPQFEWPWDPRCNNEVRLTAQELGVFGRTSIQIGAEQVQALVPVGLSYDNQGVGPPYRALLMASGRLQEVFVSLWHYGAGAQPTRIFSERPLRARPYLAETPIPVTFDGADVASPGLYRARLNVQVDERETQAVDFFFIGAR